MTIVIGNQVLWVLCQWPEDENADGYSIRGIFASASAAMRFAYRNHELSYHGWMKDEDRQHGADCFDHKDSENWSIECHKLMTGDELNPNSRFYHPRQEGQA